MYKKDGVSDFLPEEFLALNPHAGLSHPLSLSPSLFTPHLWFTL